MAGLHARPQRDRPVSILRTEQLEKTFAGGDAEAVVAAVWLDGGLDAARAFVRPLFADRVRALERAASVDARSRLQELLEGKGKARPVYTVDEIAGPPHARVFHTSVLADGQRFGPAPGNSKRSSAAAAASLALASLGPDTAP